VRDAVGDPGEAGGVMVRANAKVNLWLRVMGRRRDGYHDIETIFHGIGLADDLWIRPIDSSEVVLDVEFETGTRGPLPALGDNLAARAANELAARHRRPPAVAITILKRIPIGAGMGGGSADAAATLVALNRLWGLRRPHHELAELGARLGSDVPYCLLGGSALATGRGEVLSPIAAPRALWFVLGLSPEPLLTRDVYAGSRASGPTRQRGDVRELMSALGVGDVAGIGARLHNGLEPAIFRARPALQGAKEAVLQAGAAGACVSGSGPTVFGLARDEAHARALATRIEPLFFRVVVASSRAEGVEWLDPSDRSAPGPEATRGARGGL
jgi:4-diphosphocytidyl-2-C-methyl-D-erythritol kinase